ALLFFLRRPPTHHSPMGGGHAKIIHSINSGGIETAAEAHEMLPKDTPRSITLETVRDMFRRQGRRWSRKRPKFVPNAVPKIGLRDCSLFSNISTGRWRTEKG